jgi:thioredoxin 1
MSNFLFSTNTSSKIVPTQLDLANISDPNSPNGITIDQNKKTIPTICFDISSFQQKLIENNGLIIFKFGATWCKPCKIVEPHFGSFYERLLNYPQANNIECINIDVDDSFELYATMKRYKMVKGLPTFLAFYKGNNSYIAEESCIGSDINQLNDFFKRSIDKFGKLKGFTDTE